MHYICVSCIHLLIQYAFILIDQLQGKLLGKQEEREKKILVIRPYLNIEVLYEENCNYFNAIIKDQNKGRWKLR